MVSDIPSGDGEINLFLQCSDISAGDGKITNLFLQCIPVLGELILGGKVALMRLKVQNICTSMEELETVQSHFG